MDFFKTLQEVADLPNQGSTSRGDAAGADDAASEFEDLSREELIGLVLSERKRVLDEAAKTDAVKKEATDISEQFGAFKTKVNSWREQMKAARAQDRKTIEALRQAAAATNEGGTAAAPTSSVDKLYVTSLEEQVAALKESVRRHVAERDELQLELERVKSRAKQELQDAIHAAERAEEQVAAAAAAAASTAASQESGASPGRTDAAAAEAAERAAATHQATAQRYQRLVSQLEEDSALQKQKMATLERANEVLTSELDQANDALAKAVADHTKQLADAKADAARTSSAQYAKDLEVEIQQYRRQLTRLQDDLAESQTALAAATAGSSVPTGAAVAPSEGAAADRATAGEGASGSPPDAATPPAVVMSPAQRVGASVADFGPINASSRVRKLEQRVTELEGELKKKAAELEEARDETVRVQALLSEIEAEGEMREETINSVFAENKSLRERVDALKSDAAKADDAVAQLQGTVRDREAAAAEANSKVEELSKELGTAQKHLLKAQRELSDKADEARQLKLAELQRQTEDRVRAQQEQQQRTAVAAVASQQQQQQQASSGTPDDVITARLQAAAMAAKYQRYLAAGKQMWSNARLRMYAIAAGVIMLLILFMFHQGAAIEQDVTNVELLRRCKEFAKLGRLNAPAA